MAQTISATAERRGCIACLLLTLVMVAVCGSAAHGQTKGGKDPIAAEREQKGTSELTAGQIDPALKAGLDKAQGLLTKLTTPGSDGVTLADRLSAALGKFVQKDLVKDRNDPVPFSNFAINVAAYLKAPLDPAQARLSFQAWAGLWTGKWGATQMHHAWSSTFVTQFGKQPTFTAGGITVSEVQFAWIGDGPAWNIVGTTAGGQTMMFGVIHHNSGTPLVGLRISATQLMWIGDGFLYCEQLTQNGDYEITGFKFGPVTADGKLPLTGFEKATYQKEKDGKTKADLKPFASGDLTDQVMMPASGAVPGSLPPPAPPKAAPPATAPPMPAPKAPAPTPSAPLATVPPASEIPNTPTMPAPAGSPDATSAPRDSASDDRALQTLPEDVTTHETISEKLSDQGLVVGPAELNPLTGTYSPDYWRPPENPVIPDCPPCKANYEHWRDLVGFLIGGHNRSVSLAKQVATLRAELRRLEALPRDAQNPLAITAFTSEVDAAVRSLVDARTDEVRLRSAERAAYFEYLHCVEERCPEGRKAAVALGGAVLGGNATGAPPQPPTEKQSVAGGGPSSGQSDNGTPPVDRETLVPPVPPPLPACPTPDDCQRRLEYALALQSAALAAVDALRFVDVELANAASLEKQAALDRQVASHSEDLQHEYEAFVARAQQDAAAATSPGTLASATLAVEEFTKAAALEQQNAAEFAAHAEDEAKRAKALRDHVAQLQADAAGKPQAAAAAWQDYLECLRRLATCTPPASPQPITDVPVPGPAPAGPGAQPAGDGETGQEEPPRPARHLTPEPPDLTPPTVPCAEAAGACKDAAEKFASAVAAYQDANAKYATASDALFQTSIALGEAVAVVSDAYVGVPEAPDFVTAVERLRKVNDQYQKDLSARDNAADDLSEAATRALAAKRALADCYEKARELCPKAAGQQPPVEQSGGGAAPTDGAAGDVVACPQCEPFALLVRTLELQDATLKAAAGTIADSIRDAQAKQNRLRAEIAAEDRYMQGQAGTGGSGFDPATGLTVESITQPNGLVKITVRDQSGTVVAQLPPRMRNDFKAAKARKAKAEAALAELAAQLAALKADLDRAQQAIAATQAALTQARAALEHCLALCRARNVSRIGLGGCALGGLLSICSQVALCEQVANCLNMEKICALPGSGPNCGTPLLNGGGFQSMMAAQPMKKSQPATRGALENEVGSYRYAALRWSTDEPGLAPGTPVFLEVAYRASASPAEPSVELVANGRSTGEAFTLRVRDPAGRYRTVALPEGLVLEPMQQRAGEVEGTAPPSIEAPVGAFCLEFSKLPPRAGMLYRVAPQEVQERFNALRHILAAGRTLADAGKLHPDSNPDSYADAIRQYALWARLEHWGSAEFTAALIERTKKNAHELNVKWTDAMEQTLRAAAPNRWRDVEAVLAQAAGAIPRSAAH